MDAVQFLKAWDRMCHDYRMENAGCLKCPLCDMRNGLSIDCEDFLQAEPEKAVEIVEKWAAEHPEKPRRTYADVFFEKFPKAKIRELCKGKIPAACKHLVFGKLHCCVIHGGDCEQCWLEEYKDGEENE